MEEEEEKKKKGESVRRFVTDNRKKFAHAHAKTDSQNWSAHT